MTTVGDIEKLLGAYTQAEISVLSSNEEEEYVKLTIPRFTGFTNEVYKEWEEIPKDTPVTRLSTRNHVIVILVYDTDIKKEGKGQE